MTTPLVKLTLVYPTEVDEMLVEALLDLEPPLSGFTTHRVDGHGTRFDTATVGERVRGRTARVMLITILPPDRVTAVIDQVRATLRFAHGTWWVEPISEFGRL
ncbi:DUF3240 family protein [Parapedomonas caeni]